MGFEGPASQEPVIIEGCEVPAYKVPVNEFVANHRMVPAKLAYETRIHSGELEKADLSDKEVALQFQMLAENCSSILLLAEDDSLKQDACASVIETVVRLQNPEYATDQIEVRNEAHRLHAQYEKAKGRLVRDGLHDIAVIDRLQDPSEVLLRDFDVYVSGHYDLDTMREQAAETLLPMIDDLVIDEFGEIAGIQVEKQPSQPSLLKRLGQFVSRRTVDLKVA